MKQLSSNAVFNKIRYDLLVKENIKNFVAMRLKFEKKIKKKGILVPRNREGNQFTELRRKWFEGIKLNVDKFDCKYRNNTFLSIFYKKLSFSIHFALIKFISSEFSLRKQ